MIIFEKYAIRYWCNVTVYRVIFASWYFCPFSIANIFALSLNSLGQRCE